MCLSPVPLCCVLLRFCFWSEALSQRELPPHVISGAGRYDQLRIAQPQEGKKRRKMQLTRRRAEDRRHKVAKGIKREKRLKEIGK